MTRQSYAVKLNWTWQPDKTIWSCDKYRSYVYSVHGNNLSQHFGIQADQSIIFPQLLSKFGYYMLLPQDRRDTKGSFPGLDMKNPNPQGLDLMM